MDIAIYTLKSIAITLTDPSLVIILVVLAIILHSQNKKTTVMQKMIVGERLNSPLELTISQLVLGIFGGIFASLILSYTGVMFEQNSGIEYIFLISIILMLWNPRLICFAYSGAVLGIFSIIYNEFIKTYPTGAANIGLININIVALMTLIGVLHVIEGFLVLIDGSRGTIPVFTNKDGKIIGGFAYKRYWPIPIVLLFIIKSELVSGGEAISTPNWWPIINLNYSLQFLKEIIIQAVPLYGILGYTSITFTKTKVEKSTLSGIFILSYGVLLSFVAQLAGYGLGWQISVLLFAPAAHEGMIRFQKYLELKGEPKFISDGDGIMVLEVAPGSPAEEMGIISGDTLLKINNKIIENETDIMESIHNPINYMSLKIKRSSGREEELNYTNLSKEKRLGVVFVPKGLPKDSVIVKFEEGKFGDILDKTKDKDEDDE